VKGQACPDEAWRPALFLYIFFLRNFWQLLLTPPVNQVAESQKFMPKSLRRLPDSLAGLA
jgi:hypothetical protein